MCELSGCLDGHPEGKLIFSKEMEKLDESPFHYCVNMNTASTGPPCNILIKGMI